VLKIANGAEMLDLILIDEMMRRIDGSEVCRGSKLRLDSRSARELDSSMRSEAGDTW
jgi:CheY-like chemotaxis protein